jgi:NADH-quinone oxidoreductase subunit C
MIIECIKEAMPGAIEARHDFRGDNTIIVALPKYFDVVKFIFDEGYQLLIYLTAVDWPDRQPRFDLVAHFQNLVSQERLRVKAAIAEGQAAPSITPIHKGALWFEREVFDMFGIHFDVHPSLKRLMLWAGFEGHPLRKDFNLDGGDAWCALDMGASYSGAAKSLAE